MAFRCRRSFRLKRTTTYVCLVFLCGFMLMMFRSSDLEDGLQKVQKMVITAPRDYLHDVVTFKPANPSAQEINNSSESSRPESAPKTPPAPITADSQGHFVRPEYLTSATIIAGVPRKTPAYLVVGVPTVNRGSTSYLVDTLKGLVNGLEEDDKQHVLIVVFVADLDNDAHAKKVAKDVDDAFPNELKSSLIIVVTAPASYYPTLKKLPVLHGDKPDRIYWRSKQCLDYAFLFGYAGGLGKYYLQIEDDIITTSGYHKQIRNFVTANEHRRWLFLEFGNTGFIGMLFKGADTRKLSVFFRMYYWVFPIDFLFRHFADFELYGNPKWTVSKPPLFLHIGKISSLKGQIRKLTAQEKTASRHITNIHQTKTNPSALLSTSMKDTVSSIGVHVIYQRLPNSLFWARKVLVGDHITVEFEKPVKVYKVLVESGCVDAPEDSFGGGRLETSPGDNSGKCVGYTVWKEFGEVKTLVAETSNKTDAIYCKCIRMVLTAVRKTPQGKPRWLAIPEFAVWGNPA